MMKFLGTQFIVEYKGCNEEVLDNPKFIEECMHTAAIKANATVVQQFFHQFSPFGVSGTVVIAESHLNIHTWPEHQYAAVDIFTCGDTLNAEAAIEYIKECLGAHESHTSVIKRGEVKM